MFAKDWVDFRHCFEHSANGATLQNEAFVYVLFWSFLGAAPFDIHDRFGKNILLIHWIRLRNYYPERKRKFISC